MTDGVQIIVVPSQERADVTLEVVHELLCEPDTELQTDYIPEDDRLRLTARTVSGSLERFDGRASDPLTVPDVPSLRLRIGSAEFHAGERPVGALLDLLRELYYAVDPQYCCGLDPGHVEGIRRQAGLPVTEESLANTHVETASWLMLFPPEMVAAYGREFLLSAPAWRVEEVDDGAVLLVASSDPFDPETGTALGELDRYFGKT